MLGPNLKETSESNKTHAKANKITVLLQNKTVSTLLDTKTKRLVILLFNKKLVTT